MQGNELIKAWETWPGRMACVCGCEAALWSAKDPHAFLSF